MTIRETAPVYLRELKGALVCGVMQKDREVYVLAESEAGKTYLITLAGKSTEDIEGVFRTFYGGSMAAAVRYYENMQEKEEAYRFLKEIGEGDAERLRRLEDHLSLAENIFGDDPAYTADVVMRKRRSQYRKFVGALTMVRPRTMEVDRNWKSLQKKNYVRIVEVSRNEDERMILVPRSRKTLSLFEVLDLKRDERSIPEIGEELCGVLIPSLSPWWQERYHTARSCLICIQRIETENDENKLMELHATFKELLAPYSGMNEGDDALCSFLRKKLRLAKMAAKKCQKAGTDA